ncbi:mechanosensitive ion channel family protein [Streptomyces synnematoformans]|uniref:Mechanosensitive ion channel family protein n=1 Tax=Streptomyces synnematoformans TaxID=415721 RepID=A0ABP5KA54_9ACTN
MSVTRLPAAESPSPSLEDSRRSAEEAAGWLQENWTSWLGVGLRILLIAVIAYVLRRVVQRMITRLIARMTRTADAVDGTALGGLLVNHERRRQRSEALGSILRSGASFVILGTAALTILSALEIDLAPLLASAGVAGVAIGFGARNLVMDFLSGIFMLVEDQYGVGDTIDVGEVTGEVIEVGLRVTKLRGDNGAIWYMRNGEVKRIGNLSQGWATAAVDVPVPAGEDLDQVRAAILAAGEELGRTEPWSEQLWGEVEVLGLTAVSQGTATLQVQVKTMPGKSFGVERELRWRIRETLLAAGIVMSDLPTGVLVPPPGQAAVVPRQQPAPGGGDGGGGGGE